jgi:hypothetical protein
VKLLIEAQTHLYLSAMSDQNAPSWLTQDDVPNGSSASAEKAPKPAGVFKMFSKEAATAHVQKAAVDHVTSNAQQGIASAPDDGFTPAWATAKAYTPPNDVENPAITPAVPVSSSKNGPAPLELDPALEKRMLFYHRVLRIMYQLAASLMGISAGLSLINQTNLGSIFFAVYVLFFCLIMFCFEIGFSVSASSSLIDIRFVPLPMNLIHHLTFHPQMIAACFAINFGFLYTLTGRFIFVVFVGVMSFSLSLFGKISMAILFAVLLMHIILMCMFPKFSRYVREKDLRTIHRST